MAIVWTCETLCALIFAIIFPPLGVLLHRGCHKDLCINVLLTLLGYIPGIIHALFLICTTPGASLHGPGVVV